MLTLNVNGRARSIDVEPEILPNREHQKGEHS